MKLSIIFLSKLSNTIVKCAFYFWKLSLTIVNIILIWTYSWFLRWRVNIVKLSIIFLSEFSLTIVNIMWIWTYSWFLRWLVDVDEMKLKVVIRPVNVVQYWRQSSGGLEVVISKYYHLILNHSNEKFYNTTNFKYYST